jgi:hypothetical protein
MGINSTSEDSFYYEEYREYSEKTLQEHFGYVFKKKDIYLKRAHKRIAANIKIVYLEWRIGFWKNFYKGTIKNLSEKGMFISLDYSLLHNSLIEICIPVKKRKRKFISLLI